MNNQKQYYLIPNYSMKCRLYPNKEAKEMIDRIINGVEKAYNIATYGAAGGIAQNIYSKRYE